MESNTICQNDYDAFPLSTGFSNNNLKLEILDDEFCIGNLSSSKCYLQEFQNLEQFPSTASSFDWGVGIQANGFDPFDPLCHGSSTDLDLYELKPCNGNGSMIASMQDFKGGGFLNFADRKDSLMEFKTTFGYEDPKPLCFIVPDESSCVTADNFGCHNKDGSKRKSIIQSNNSNDSESVSTKKCSRGRKKSESAKGQWTTEEDRLLIHLVEKYGVRKWSNIAQMLKGRIGKQCRERWHNHLRPDIKVGFEFSVLLNI